MCKHNKLLHSEFLFQMCYTPQLTEITTATVSSTSIYYSLVTPSIYLENSYSSLKFIKDNPKRYEERY